MKGRDKLVRAIKRSFDTKANQETRVPAVIGKLSATGAQLVNNPNRPNYIYVRLRGNDAEVVDALNDTVGAQYDLHIWVKWDDSTRTWKVIERDSTKSAWWGGSSGLKKHGKDHSFDNPSNVYDPVFVYKRQMAQPLQGHPTSPESMSVYVEPDFYYWSGAFKYFAGGTSAVLTASLPGPAEARFVTVYLRGNDGTIQTINGATFPAAASGITVASYITAVDPAIGIPLLAVYLPGTTLSISWPNCYDIRVLTGAGAPTGAPTVHGLDPSAGFHTGSLPADDVSVADPSGVFTSTNVEDALYELYSQVPTGTNGLSGLGKRRKSEVSRTTLSACCNTSGKTPTVLGFWKLPPELLRLGSSGVLATVRIPRYCSRRSRTEPNVATR